MKNIGSQILILINVLFTSSICCFAQSHDIFYEQIAFDFYRTEVLKNSNVGGKFKISKRLESISYVSTECLQNKVYEEKSINVFKGSRYFQGDQLDLANIDRKQFRKVKSTDRYRGDGKFVDVSIAYEFENRIFVVVHEFQYGSKKQYTFELDISGKIIDWCISLEYLELIHE